MSAQYICKNTEKYSEKWIFRWILFAGRTWFNFICMQGDNEDVFSVIMGSKYIVFLHLTLYLILNLNFNLTFCNLLFFRSFAVLSSVFYVLRFWVFVWVLVLAILLTFRIESPTLHIIFIRLLRAKAMNISSQLYYHDWMIGQIKWNKVINPHDIIIFHKKNIIWYFFLVISKNISYFCTKSTI